ncbi:VanZ family protein [Treponema primitia ZAS-2]|uniref:VanZ family protein n=1 Tax=Treponema primitia (strain ATCC BAA-887 / DSM 12427 / ZAS-2) TaxID=545694 RepID=F5YN61_TREPZ|nr:VanZ family protein [Treponema primitia]AEF84973.1 VanZ family protein [Treponema primitia ZAS-2]
MNITQKILPKIPTFVVIGGIFFLSSQSILPSPKGLLGFDKLQHLIAYLVLAGTIVPWFPREQWQSHRLRTLLLATFISSLYGISDEIHQYFVPGRDCNVWDWVADTIGSFLGAAAALPVCRCLFRKSKAEENQPVTP